jgi:hypothetical protein
LKTIEKKLDVPKSNGSKRNGFRKNGYIDSDVFSNVLNEISWIPREELFAPLKK